MAIAIHSIDYERATMLLLGPTENIRDLVAKLIAEERERCAKIAEAIDSGRGNEKQIAKYIREP